MPESFFDSEIRIGKLPLGFANVGIGTLALNDGGFLKGVTRTGKGKTSNFRSHIRHFLRGAPLPQQSAKAASARWLDSADKRTGIGPRARHTAEPRKAHARAHPAASTTALLIAPRRRLSVPLPHDRTASSAGMGRPLGLYTAHAAHGGRSFVVRAWIDVVESKAAGAWPSRAWRVHTHVGALRSEAVPHRHSRDTLQLRLRHDAVARPSLLSRLMVSAATSYPAKNHTHWPRCRAHRFVRGIVQFSLIPFGGPALVEMFVLPLQRSGFGGEFDGRPDSSVAFSGTLTTLARYLTRRCRRITLLPKRAIARRMGTATAAVVSTATTSPR